MAKKQLAELRQRVGRRIRHLRKGREMNQSDLGKLLGITAPAVCYIERGRNLPADKLEQMANIFEVTIDDLLSEDDPNA